MNKQFEIEMETRDYECDIQGIVNNANYLHYMEHTRHKFMQTIGLDFADLHNRGIDVVVARMNLQYKAPLRGGESFISRLTMTKEGIRYVFNQTIIRKDNGKLCMKATVEAVSVVNGRLADPEELQDALAAYLQ
jgi:acyl-CoA thioester hydrolase